LKTFDGGYRKLILVCVNEREAGEVACGGRNSRDIHMKIKECVKSKGLGGEIRVSKTRCLGHCDQGPTVAVYPEQTWYGEVTPKDADEIIRRHVDSSE
jgi:(2Fe-2S) ferredoxin